MRAKLSSVDSRSTLYTWQEESTSQNITLGLSKAAAALKFFLNVFRKKNTGPKNNARKINFKIYSIFFFFLVVVERRS